MTLSYIEHLKKNLSESPPKQKGQRTRQRLRIVGRSFAGLSLTSTTMNIILAIRMTDNPPKRPPKPMCSTPVDISDPFIDLRS